MQIVGRELNDRDEHGVHTIDIWFSERRGCWIVERLDVEGNQVGFAARCETEDDAADCLADWLRAHDEVCLVTPLERRSARTEARVLEQALRRAA